MRGRRCANFLAKSSTELRTFALISRNGPDAGAIGTHPQAHAGVKGGIVAVHHVVRTHDGALKSKPAEDLRHLAVHGVFAHQIDCRRNTEMLAVRLLSVVDLTDVAFFIDVG